MTKKPNVLFILSDQHNAKLLSCKNHPDVKTPNLDRMASEGVRFNQAITQNPICTPSRVSYLSGQYPHNHGYYGNHGPNPGGLPTILGHFRQAGYRTGAIGKIHCPEYWVEDDCDVFLETYRKCSIGGADEYDSYLESKGLTTKRDDGFFPEITGRYRATCDARCSNLAYEDTVEGWTVRRTIDFMKQAKEEEKPFIVQASLPRPHTMYTPSEPFWSMYDEKNLTLPPNIGYDMSLKAPNFRNMLESDRTGEWTIFYPRTYEAGLMRKYHGYLGCVSQVDYAVGELIDWLKDNQMEEDTIVIYGSDHGDFACEHGMIEKAPGISSDAITRVPFIWKWPGHFQRGSVVEEIVETIDLSQTLCNLIGLDLMETSDGKILTGLLKGNKEPIHTIGVTEFAWSKSVRKGQYRYIYYPKEMFPEEYPNGFGELYDLEQDPWEMNNLYFDDKYEHLVKEIKDDLLNWLITTTRPKTVQTKFTYKGKQVVMRNRKPINADGKLNPAAFKETSGSNYL